jgi:hypothetical protein
MKLLTVILLIISFNLSINKCYPCSNHFRPQSDSTAIQAKKLKQLYLLATGSGGMNDFYRQKFFDEFPGTFSRLNELYGYDNGKAAILYDDAENHIIKLFNNLDSINDTLYYNKIITIAIGGHWDADAINYFQYGLKQRVEKNPELAVFILEKNTTENVKSFWHFYFDQPHPQKEIPDALKKIKLINEPVYNAMILAQEAALKEKEW